MNNKLGKAVALTVRHFRKECNLSQEELADKATLDRTYISGIERGVRNITLNSLEQIINALGVDIEFFIDKVKDALNDIHSE